MNNKQNWKEKQIGDHCLVGDGAHASIKRYEQGVMYLTSKNFKSGGLDLSKIDYISESDYAKYFKKGLKALTKPEAGDVLFSIIGTIGEPYLFKSQDCFGLSSSVSILRPDKSIIFPKYLFYWIQGHIFQNALYSIKGGVAQSYVSLEMIKSLPLSFPPIPTQQKITDILSAYDDLIENNTRRIKILEEMAQMLYREWFVNFRFPNHENVKMVESELGLIPEGWEVKPITEAIFVNPKTQVPKEDIKPFVPMGCLSNDSMLINNVESRSGNSGSKFKNNDTLFARITPCLENGKTGFVQFLDSKDSVAFGSTEFIVLRSKTLCPEYVYLLSRSDSFRDNAIKSMSGATGRQRVRETCFNSFMFAHPTQEIIQYFSTLISPYFSLIYNLNQRNINLRKTRDLLLPKLISGEIDVENLDIETVAAAA